MRTSLLYCLGLVVALLPAFAATARCPRPVFQAIPDGVEAKDLDEAAAVRLMKVKKPWELLEAKLAPLEGDRKALLIKRCKPRGDNFAICKLDLALLKAPAGKPMAIVKRDTIVTEPQESEDGLELGGLWVTHVDGHGPPELEVVWSITGESMAAVGSQVDQHRAFYGATDLDELWSERTEATGAGGQDSCASRLRRADVDCDGHMELLFVTDCTMAICRPESEDETVDESCEAPTVTVTLFFWDRKAKTWRKGPSADQVHDKKHWLIVLGSFRMVSARADKKAAEALAKLKAAGFKAKVLPGFTFDKVPCCYNTLIGGRFLDRKAADALMGKLKKKGFKGYVKKAFGPYRPMEE